VETGEKLIRYVGHHKLDPLADVSDSHIVEIESGGATKRVPIDISRSACTGLRYRLDNKKQHPLDPVLIAGLGRLGVALSFPALDRVPDRITFMTEDLDEIERIGREPKQCDWQRKEARTYRCLAGRDERVQATTPSDCDRCSVPDTRWICSDFVHPDIVDAGDFDDPHARFLLDARCNRGQDCVGKDCQPGGNDCWTQVVPSVALPVSPGVVDSTRPFSNERALLRLIEDADGYIWWYERHMPPKVLELLADGLANSKAQSIRILSEPLEEGKRQRLLGKLERFRREFTKVTLEWRELESADCHHDRLFFDRSRAYNLPPVNTLLKGDTSEIISSGLHSSWFETVWNQAMDVK
jgi:hypothetical protein